MINASFNDIELVYNWQINPITRKFSLNSKIPTWDEHNKWMKEKISNLKDIFYIVVDSKKNNKIGVIRLDRLKINTYLISIYIDPDYHGMGIGQSALSLLDKIHPNIIIHSKVMIKNKASQRLFTKANYKKIKPDEFLRESIQI